MAKKGVNPFAAFAEKAGDKKGGKGKQAPPFAKKGTKPAKKAKKGY